MHKKQIHLILLGLLVTAGCEPSANYNDNVTERRMEETNSTRSETVSNPVVVASVSRSDERQKLKEAEQQIKDQLREGIERLKQFPRSLGFYTLDEIYLRERGKLMSENQLNQLSYRYSVPKETVKEWRSEVEKELDQALLEQFDAQMPKFRRGETGPARITEFVEKLRLASLQAKWNRELAAARRDWQENACIVQRVKKGYQADMYWTTIRVLRTKTALSVVPAEYLDDPNRPSGRMHIRYVHEQENSIYYEEIGSRSADRVPTSVTIKLHVESLRDRSPCDGTHTFTGKIKSSAPKELNSGQLETVRNRFIGEIETALKQDMNRLPNF